MGKFSNNTLRYEYLKQYLDTFNLPKEFNEYVTNPNNNPSQHPYHNSQHCYTVAINAILAADHYRLSEKDTVELIIASIFHDWGHSGGTLTEAENIDVAVISYTSASAMFKTYLDHQSIIRLIRATQYPHIPVFELKEQIMQDADLLQHMHDDALKWIESFNNETGGNHSALEVAEFLNKQNFNTKWGKKKARQTVERLIMHYQQHGDTLPIVR